MDLFKEHGYDLEKVTATLRYLFEIVVTAQKCEDETCANIACNVDNELLEKLPELFADVAKEAGYRK